MIEQSFSITRPDDWHIHLRDGGALNLTVPHVSRYFGRAIVMPNLVPPVTTPELAEAYRQRILQHRPPGSNFEPLMTLYLTDNSTPDDIISGHENSAIIACKLYPAGATTNSASGVTNLKNIYPVLEAMQRVQMPLLIHGEVTHSEVDIFDRERVFIDQQLIPLLADFPELKVVFEHITTADAAQFVEQGNQYLAATITAHHLLYDRNHMLVGGVRPHLFCLPILKRRQHQRELLRVATSDHPRFFLGSDSAPHARLAKEAACGCAGCYSGHATLELYAQAFEMADALHQLEAFASHRGPDFYGLPRNKSRVRLSRANWTVPSKFDYCESTLIPLAASEQISWEVSDD